MTIIETTQLTAGQKVRITDDKSFHKFPVGTEVELVKPDGRYWLATTDPSVRTWSSSTSPAVCRNVSVDEIEVVGPQALYAVGDSLIISEEGSRRLGLDVGWDAGTVKEVVALSRLEDDFYYVTTNRPSGIWESFVEPAKPAEPEGFKVGDKVLVTADSNSNSLEGKEGTIAEVVYGPGDAYYETFGGIYLVTTDPSVTDWTHGVAMNVYGTEMELVVETIEAGDRVTGTGIWSGLTREGVLDKIEGERAYLKSDDGAQPIVEAKTLALVSKAPKPLTVDDVLALAKAVKSAQSEVSDAEAVVAAAEQSVKDALEALEAATLKATEAQASLSEVTKVAV